MFRADGMGVRKNDDGTIAVKVAIYDERPMADTPAKPAKKMFEQSFVGTDKTDIKTKIDAVLSKLRLAEDDSALQTEYVGKTISTI